jgi:hypothetical protein
MADNEEPRTPWRECKAIAEALTPKSQLTVEQIEQKLRDALLAQLTALGPEGADLAARLANAPTGFSVEGQPGDLKVMEQLKLRMAAMGIDEHTAIALDHDLR